MKDILDEESRKALIAYRMQRAYDTMISGGDDSGNFL